jgi:hypothetical protein
VGGTSVGLGPWPASTTPSTPTALDDVTVFAFSSTALNERDPQILELAPDMNLRAWQRWDTKGTVASDYDFSYVQSSHAAGIRFIGGTTATATFRDEVDTDAEFADRVTRDASGAEVEHTKILPGLHRGNLANPAYREYLIRVCELQIDGGVDGLFFDELNGDYQGANFDGDEGFDDYHLADFNAYLLNKYPDGTDFGSLFGMSPDNSLRRDVPAGDLSQNFDYRAYLLMNGWSSQPFAAANPLAKEWGLSIGNRPAPLPVAFTDLAEPHRYWKAIATKLKAYARSKGRDVLLTSNGVWPYVDLQSVGLYNGNNDGPNGVEVNYTPTTPDGHLQGSTSLQAPFLLLKARSEQLAPGVPVVLFIDWPTSNMDAYDALPASERQDYWRIYAAEAYANGLFFAFHLKTTTGEPSATELGVMPLFENLTAFYRAHADLYHGVTASSAKVTTTLSSAMLAVSDQGAPKRRLVHIVNHEYENALIPQQNLTLTIDSNSAPTTVTLASPDLASDTTLPFQYSDGQISVTLPSLVAYDIVELVY